ncbi:response regulator [Amycolatopsis thermophila]|uniref:Two-component system nitrate/nitrite response regulator NarL n=1 Tax=Amycolatopsis thermophila TaxID=206084 RepID=A0ABU0F373_9PSEU|nr:response regulator transcription factor [Amycolatopsis thermophila]MDQ0381535.1 two-component system nitrate/nitrite response regulator NarL [Amycolatopsis thermophila]
MISAVFADDHTLLVEAMTPLLAARGVQVVATAHDLPQVIDSVRRFDPDICLLDLHFGDAEHRGSVAAVREANPRTKVVVLTADISIEARIEAVEAGAAAYVHKTCRSECVVAAIEKAMRGEPVTDVPTRPLTPPDPTGNGALDAQLLARYLTVREHQCLALLVDGQPTTQMASRLGVSVPTVRSHVQSLMTKLGVHSRLEAASFAVRHELINRARYRS